MYLHVVVHVYVFARLWLYALCAYECMRSVLWYMCAIVGKNSQVKRGIEQK